MSQVKSNQEWLVKRVFADQDPNAINILTTRGNIVTRLEIDFIRSARKDGERLKGVRRYVTKNRADMKARKLNLLYNTSGYSPIREDQI